MDDKLWESQLWADEELKQFCVAGDKCCGEPTNCKGPIGRTVKEDSNGS